MPRHVMDEFGTLVAAPIENYAWRESSYRERWLLFNLPRMIQDLEAGVVPTVFHGYTGERIPVTSILYRVATKFRGPVFRDNPNDISYYFH
jgi:hypothetical protein